MADSIEKQIADEIDLVLKQQVNAEKVQAALSNQLTQVDKDIEKARATSHRLRHALHVIQGKSLDGAAIAQANATRAGQLRNP